MKLVIAIQPFLVNTFNTVMGVGSSNKNVFHILGVDILVDQSGKPWLLEVNASPSLNMMVMQEESKVTSKVDQELKTRVLKDCF